MNSKHPLWLWPNLLSLDAPLIAIIWQEAFSQVLHIPLAPRHRWILFLVTWTIYASDRILDSLPGKNGNTQSRHIFASKHRLYLLIACIFTALTSTWIVFSQLNIPLRTFGVLGGIIILLYFLLIHRRTLKFHKKPHFHHTPSVQNLVKEAIVAFVFTGGVALAPWVLSKSNTPPIIVCFPLFFFIAYENCSFISKWESPNSQFRLQTHFLFFTTLLTAITSFMITMILPPPLSHFSLYTGLSAVGLLALDYFSTHLHEDELRVLADVALLSPLPFFLWRIYT